MNKHLICFTVILSLEESMAYEEKNLIKRNMDQRLDYDMNVLNMNKKHCHILQRSIRHGKFHFLETILTM